MCVLSCLGNSIMHMTYFVSLYTSNVCMCFVPVISVCYCVECYEYFCMQLCFLP